MQISRTVGELLGTFIVTVLALAITPKVIDYSHAIEVNTNASDLVQLIAPYIPLFWVFGILSMAGAVSYVIVTKRK